MSQPRITVGFKLLRVRANGTLGSLFINTKQIIPVGEWLNAKPIPTKGFKFRPGWHACAKKSAPHLSKRGRVWCKVALQGVTKYVRPASQGGVWFTATRMKIVEVLWKFRRQ